MSIKILVEIMEDKLATKQNFAELKSTIAGDFAVASMTNKQDLLQFKHDLTIKMAVLLSGAVTLAVTLVTAIHKFT